MVVIDTARLGWHHMTSDDMAELHSFAKKIGLKREWFQDKPGHPHYDVMVNRAPIKKAIAFNVKEISKKEYVEFVIKHHRQKE